MPYARVWERRYGFPVPGDRRPAIGDTIASQVQMLCRLTRLSRDNRQPISELIAGLQTGGLDLGRLRTGRQ